VLTRFGPWSPADHFQSITYLVSFLLWCPFFFLLLYRSFCARIQCNVSLLPLSVFAPSRYSFYVLPWEAKIKSAFDTPRSPPVQPFLLKTTRLVFTHKPVTPPPYHLLASTVTVLLPASPFPVSTLPDLDIFFLFAERISRTALIFLSGPGSPSHSVCERRASFLLAPYRSSV